jgi:hypothetical protein
MATLGDWSCAVAQCRPNQNALSHMQAIDEITTTRFGRRDSRIK